MGERNAVIIFTIKQLGSVPFSSRSLTVRLEVIFMRNLCFSGIQMSPNTARQGTRRRTPPVLPSATRLWHPSPWSLREGHWAIAHRVSQAWALWSQQ